jgi:HK97 family phage major capsid protein
VRSGVRSGERAAGRTADTAAINSQLENTLDLKELRTKRDAFMNTGRNILVRAESEGRALTADEKKDYDGLMAKIKAIGETLDRASQFGEMRADIERPVVSGPVVQPDGNGMIHVPRYVTPGEVRAFKPNEAIAEQPYHGPGLGAYVRGIVTGKWNGAEDLRALAEGSTPGSYLVPTPLAGYIIDLVRNQAQVLRAGAVTIPFDSQTLKIGRQTGDVTAAWKAENAAITFSDANFDVVTFTAQMLVAGSKLSIEVVEDAPNIDAIVSQSITKALALAVDYAALYGSGSSNQPKGIRNTTNVTVTDLGTNGYTLIDYSKFSAGIATLMGNNFTGPFSILYSARTAGELDNLQDTLHQPLRQPDLVAAARKFVTNQISNALTKGSANTSSDAFIGQFEHCMIGVRTGMVMEISRVAADSTGSAFTNAQVWIRAYLRADVQLAHPQAFVVLNGIL